MRIGRRGGAKTGADVSNTLLLCGARRCLDIDLEELISGICGQKTCRLHPMQDRGRRRRELTTSAAFRVRRRRLCRHEDCEDPALGSEDEADDEWRQE